MEETSRIALGKADKKNFEEGLFHWPSSMYGRRYQKAREK
jgi:hypothetical protein